LATIVLDDASVSSNDTSPHTNVASLARDVDLESNDGDVGNAGSAGDDFMKLFRPNLTYKA
jgi:hypothetical protein